MKEALGSSETSVLITATRCNIPEDCILHRMMMTVGQWVECLAAKTEVPGEHLLQYAAVYHRLEHGSSRWVADDKPPELWYEHVSPLKNGVFWVVTPCGSCKYRRFGGTWRVFHQGATPMKEALSSSETSVLTRATRGNIPEDAILHSHRRENLKSYMFHL
jgi:hypothetical protein